MLRKIEHFFYDLKEEEIDSSKRFLSFSLLSCVENEEEFLKYVSQVREPSIPFTCGTIVHELAAGTYKGYPYIAESDKIVDGNVYISLETLNNLFNLNSALKQSSYMQNRKMNDLKYEIKLVKRIYYNGRVFYIKCYIDCLDFTENTAIEFKTSSIASRSSIPSVKYVMTKYCYNLQGYIYLKMLDKVRKLQFIFLNKKKQEVVGFDFINSINYAYMMDLKLEKFINLCKKHKIMHLFLIDEEKSLIDGEK